MSYISIVLLVCVELVAIQKIEDRLLQSLISIDKKSVDLLNPRDIKLLVNSFVDACIYLICFGLEFLFVITFSRHSHLFYTWIVAKHLTLFVRTIATADESDIIEISLYIANNCSLYIYLRSMPLFLTLGLKVMTLPNFTHFLLHLIKAMRYIPLPPCTFVNFLRNAVADVLFRVLTFFFLIFTLIPQMILAYQIMCWNPQSDQDKSLWWSPSHIITQYHMLVLISIQLKWMLTMLTHSPLL